MIRYYIKIVDMTPTFTGGEPFILYKRADSEKELESVLRKDFIYPEHKTKEDVYVTVVGAELIED